MAALDLACKWGAPCGAAAVPEDPPSSGDDLQAEPHGGAGTVGLTLMNVPCRCTIADVLELIHDSGFQGHFDRLFMPMKATDKRNKGFVFVTFTDPRQALLFQCATDGMRFGSRTSSKEVVVAWTNETSASQTKIPEDTQVFMSRWGRVLVPPPCTFSL